MTQATAYQPPRASPTTLGIVILLHGAVLGALVLAKMEMPPKETFTSLDTYRVRPKPIPDPIPPDDIKPAPRQRVETVERIIETPPQREQPVFAKPETTPAEAEPIRLASIDPPRREQIITPPVRREARIDPRSELKPPYPASEQRMGTEGVVTLRVLIGADGKVKSAEKMRATNDIFYQATVRHALRNWRFKPATLDGRPIESSKVMTLHFELNDDA